MRAEATLPNMNPFWASTKNRYVPNMCQGITHIPQSIVRGDVRYGFDDLVFYDTDGLAGVLTYFPQDIPDTPDELGYEGGTYTISVDPAKQRRGIGTALIKEMSRRWSVDFENQTYSDAGLALVKAFIKAGR